MRAIGEGTVTEYAFKKWWIKNCGRIVMPHSYPPVIVEAISSVSTAKPPQMSRKRVVLGLL